MFSATATDLTRPQTPSFPLVPLFSPPHHLSEPRFVCVHRWLWDALDVITPSIYVGIPADQTTDEHTRAYVQETVTEAVRLASASKGPTLVMPYMWYLVNNYWQVRNPNPNSKSGYGCLRCHPHMQTCPHTHFRRTSFLISRSHVGPSRGQRPRGSAQTHHAGPSCLSSLTICTPQIHVCIYKNTVTGQNTSTPTYSSIHPCCCTS